MRIIKIRETDYDPKIHRLPVADGIVRSTIGFNEFIRVQYEPGQDLFTACLCLLPYPIEDWKSNNAYLKGLKQPYGVIFKDVPGAYIPDGGSVRVFQWEHNGPSWFDGKWYLFVGVED